MAKGKLYDKTEQYKRKQNNIQKFWTKSGLSETDLS